MASAWFELIVDAKGKPQNVHIKRCTDPSFEENSLKAVEQFRFKPATKEGRPVSVYTSVEIRFRLYDSFGRGQGLAVPIRYGMNTPPGVTSSNPDANGVYPLTNAATPPTLNGFSDEGYGSLAFLGKDHGACDIVLTINAKGKPSDPQVTRCEIPALETPAVQSLLNSKYKPGKVNGKAVPMRVNIHLECGDNIPKP